MTESFIDTVNGGLKKDGLEIIHTNIPNEVHRIAFDLEDFWIPNKSRVFEIPIRRAADFTSGYELHLVFNEVQFFVWRDDLFRRLFKRVALKVMGDEILTIPIERLIEDNKTLFEIMETRNTYKSRFPTEFSMAFKLRFSDQELSRFYGMWTQSVIVLEFNGLTEMFEDTPSFGDWEYARFAEIHYEAIKDREGRPSKAECAEKIKGFISQELTPTRDAVLGVLLGRWSVPTKIVIDACVVSNDFWITDMSQRKRMSEEKGYFIRNYQGDKIVYKGGMSGIEKVRTPEEEEQYKKMQDFKPHKKENNCCS